MNISMKDHWNTKVASTRSDKWRENLISGRFDAQLNPTRVRVLRCKKNIRQQDVAENMGLTYSTYGAIENARRPVKREKALLVLKVLKIPKKDFSKYFQEQGEKYIAAKSN